LTKFTERALQTIGEDVFFSIGVSGLMLSVIEIVFLVHDSWQGLPITVNLFLFFIGVLILIASVLFDAFYDKAYSEGNLEDFVA
jgi:cytochrome b subunit of formate dehydrogenase